MVFAFLSLGTDSLVPGGIVMAKPLVSDFNLALALICFRFL